MAGYIGTQAVSVNTTSATISDDLSVGDDLTVTDDAAIGGTLAVTGVVTANAGVVVDNFTLDGTTLALSSGNFTLDVAGDIILDADGGDILFKDNATEWLGFNSGGTMTAAGAFILDVNGNISFDSNNGVIDFKGPSALTFGRIENASSDFKFESRVQDKDIVFVGNDGGAGVTALTLSMANAGAATFNSTITLKDTLAISNSSTSAFLQTSTNILQFGTSSNDPIQFFANNEEQMRINANGNVAIGTTSDSFALVVSTGASAAQLQLARPTDGSTRSIAIFRSSSEGADVGTISVTNNATAYNTSSDYRLKENVDYSWDATTRLKQLKPARFNWISDDTDTTIDGFMAHEAQAVVPEAVHGTHNEVDDDGVAVMQGIDQGKLVPLLVKTILELEARITVLEG